MLLKKLVLKNIKSHKDTTIEFQPGINAIIGDNGSGKSTILEAIGTVLFQHLDYKSKQFIRFGEKKGRIELTFNAIGFMYRSGKTPTGEINITTTQDFTIVKTFGSNSEYYLETQEGRIDLKEEIIPQLHQMFNIDNSIDLTRLFQDVIGVPQGMQTSHFLLPPTARKKIFDPILNIEAYPDAWKRLLQVVNFANDKIQECELSIELLRGNVSDYDELKQETKLLSAQVKELIESVEERTITMGKLDCDKISMEEKKEQVHELEMLELKVNKATIDLEVVNKDLDNVEASEKELKELQPKLKRAASIDEDLISISGHLARWAITRSNKDKLEDDIRHLDDENTKIKSQLEDYDKVTRIANTLAAIEQEYEESELSLLKANHKVEHLEGYKDFVDQGKCPILENDCPKDDLKKKFGELLSAAKNTEDAERLLNNIKPKLAEAKRAMDERRNLDALTEKLRENLEALKDMNEHFNMYSEQGKEVKKHQDRQKELNDESKSLGEPKLREQTLKDIVDNRLTYEREIGALIDVIEGSSPKIKELKEKTEDFDSGALEYVTTKHQEAVVAFATYKETLRKTTETLSNVESKIEHKKEQMEEIVSQERELERLTLIHNKIVEVRGLMKDIPEHLVERYLTHINYDANIIFSEITNKDSNIEWHSDYEVVVDHKTFSQLSGGEQMIVALALRLALLKNITKIDVAIFDEPTVNLDESHRVGLAEMIQNISGFSQIFVVSHDDTFSSVIENVIQIEKQDGISQII